MRIVNPLAFLPQAFFAVSRPFSIAKPFLYNPIGEIYNKQLKLTGLHVAGVLLKALKWRINLCRLA
jgi:hypothetical protein